MTERKKVLLRLDPDIYDAVARWAADDLRSVNAQIEYALRRALQSAGRARPPTPDQPPDLERDPVSERDRDRESDPGGIAIGSAIRRGTGQPAE